MDTLSAGFNTVNRQPWLIALPLLLDLLLWRGPLITPLPFVERLLAAYTEALAATGGELADPARLAEMRGSVEVLASGFNMLSLLALNFVASVPILGVDRPGDAALVLAVESGGVFVGLIILLELAGMLLGCVYFGLLAQQVRDGRLAPAMLVARLGRYFQALLGLTLLALGVIVGAGVPLLIVVALALLLGGPVGSSFVLALMVGGWVAALWAVLFLYFVVDAIVVSEAPARRAILVSVSVVGKNFWSALAFVFLTFVITAGTRIIWSNLGDSVGARLPVWQATPTSSAGWPPPACTSI